MKTILMTLGIALTLCLSACGGEEGADVSSELEVGETTSALCGRPCNPNKANACGFNGCCRPTPSCGYQCGGTCSEER